jgi:hypothetical protein
MNSNPSAVDNNILEIVDNFDVLSDESLYR